MSRPDDLKTRVLLELAEQLKARDYSIVQTLPAPHPRPTFLGIGKEFVTTSSWAVSGTAPHRLFDPSPFASAQYARFHGKHPDAFMLFTAFFRNQAVAMEPLSRCLGEQLIHDLLETGVLTAVDGGVRSTVKAIPYHQCLLLTDPTDRQIPGFTYIGKDSIDMADFLRRRLKHQRFGRGLDICTGSGIHALLLADSCREVVGVDINPRAVQYAQRNAAINHKDNTSFLCADLASPMSGRFDLVVSNPPLRFLPTDEQSSNRDGFGGALGIEFTQHVLGTLEDRLGDGGLGIIGSVAPVVKGENVLVREVDRVFAGKPFEIECIFTDLTYSREHAALHQRHQISYLLPCYILVRRSTSYRMTLTHRIPYKPVKQAVVRFRARPIRRHHPVVEPA